MNATETATGTNRSTVNKKVLYTAKTHTVGGRDGGTARSSDGRLDIKLSVPGTAGSGTNPSNCSPPAGRPALRERWVWRLAN